MIEYPQSIVKDRRLICCDEATDRPYHFFVFNCDNKFRLCFYFVVTLGCKSNRIEENAVIESSFQLVIPIVSSRSGIKC